MNEAQIADFRKQKDQMFKQGAQSPLRLDQQRRFTQLSYYPYNEALDLTVEVTPFDEKKDIEIQTTTGETRWYRRYGEFRFELEGEEVRLTIYQAPHGFFLPFVDAGAGKETYPAGRYLEPDQIEGNTFHINFNLTYNPYCAYNGDWTCPITPAENRLSVHIQAGEKMPPAEWA